MGRFDFTLWRGWLRLGSTLSVAWIGITELLVLATAFPLFHPGLPLNWVGSPNEQIARFIADDIGHGLAGLSPAAWVAGTGIFIIVVLTIGLPWTLRGFLFRSGKTDDG